MRAITEVAEYRHPMRMRGFLALTLLFGTIAVPAHAQTPVPGVVTLEASEDRVSFRDPTILSGSIDPPNEGEQIDLVDEAGVVRASTTTDGQGRFRTTLRPPNNTTLTARWLAAISEPVDLRVVPKVTASLSKVRLFGSGLVGGSVRPVIPGRVGIEIRRAGRTIAKTSAQMRDGRFRASFPVNKTGAHRAVVSFDGEDHAPARRWSAPLSPRTPSLGEGSRGDFVRLLERRLLELRYHLDGIDASYDYRTRDAVIAFNKVQGRARLGSVDASTWRALASPKIPRPVSVKPKTHWEIDQTKQVVYLVKEGEIVRIIHTSTGAGSATRDGVFKVHRKLAGYSGNGLYYPSYWDGLRAFHGWSDVPTYNASHGCSRLPMWSARWVYDRAPIGIEVRIYHS